MIEAALALQAVQIGAGTCVVLSSLEYLHLRAEFKDEGWLSWRIARDLHRTNPAAAVSRAMDAAFSYPAVLGLIAVRMGLGLVLLVAPFGHSLAAGAAALAGLTCFALARRCPFGQEGSDQLTLLLTTSLAIGSLSPRAAILALTFIALQLCLAYVTAGAVKLLSPGWRNGTALQGIFRTRVYGHPLIARIVSQALVAAALSWLVIGWELSFPLAILAGRGWFWAALLAGVAFHVSTAVFMGLNNFMVIFLAAYPALIWAAERISGA